MEFLSDDAVLHRYTCNTCKNTINSFLVPPSCRCNKDQVWLLTDEINSVQTFDSGQIVQYDSINSVDEYVDEEVERDDLDKATREMERLRRGIGIENDRRQSDAIDGEAEI